MANNRRKKKLATHTATIGGRKYNLTREGWSDVLQQSDASISNGLAEYGTMQKYIDKGLKRYSTICRLRYSFLFNGTYRGEHFNHSLENRGIV